MKMASMGVAVVVCAASGIVALDESAVPEPIGLAMLLPAAPLLARRQPA